MLSQAPPPWILNDWSLKLYLQSNYLHWLSHNQINIITVCILHLPLFSPEFVMKLIIWSLSLSPACDMAAGQSSHIYILSVVTQSPCSQEPYKSIWNRFHSVWHSCERKQKSPNRSQPDLAQTSSKVVLKSVLKCFEGYKSSRERSR